ncbi:MAG: septum formation protein Maf [bacterium (Candidatus Stahlbacteria) CG23_combo_of_CG06-09_8_20_14_all_34_7]|nr:MAG: septum formation protein Maf [bacterium (Candidatus Stahlbacteria) CG23_combo_of_CG06-09_8_20_14_all_34_7]
MKIILASKSPRRIEILKKIGLKFTVRNHKHSEEHLNIKSPSAFVRICSKHKAESTVIREDELVIGADTIVYMEGKIIGKPISRESAKKMLKLLSGKKHIVYTGLTLIYKENEINGVQRTNVYFKKIEDREIYSYLEKAKYMDKAGAYAVQEEASLFIEKISGDFFNIVGFPVLLFSDLFEKVSGEKLYNVIWNR